MEHKFFERYLDNDLESLTKYLIDIKEGLDNYQFPNITQEQIDKARENETLNPGLRGMYNLFRLDNPEIQKIKDAVIDMVREACEYYGDSFDDEKYYIRGWVNCESNYIFKETHLHDHLGGTGAPNFHGYYCVNAEPSITTYSINKENKFVNVNKNNRAIVSETGHPHAIGNWNEDSKRITVAYDIISTQGITITDSQDWMKV